VKQPPGHFNQPIKLIHGQIAKVVGFRNWTNNNFVNYDKDELLPIA
jgi:hypothetical protein